MPCFVLKQSATLSPFAMFPPAFPAPNLQPFQHPQFFHSAAKQCEIPCQRTLFKWVIEEKRNSLLRANKLLLFPLRKEDNSTAREKKNKTNDYPQSLL